MSSHRKIKQRSGDRNGRNLTRCPDTGESIFYDDWTDPDRLIYRRLGLEMKGWPTPPERPKPRRGEQSDVEPGD